MSDSLSWVDDAENRRIRGILARSMDVIAAARQDLEEDRCCLENQLSTDLLKRDLSYQSASQQQTTSAERRARFRQLLRNPDSLTPARSYHQADRNFFVDLARAEDIGEPKGVKSSFEIHEPLLSWRESRPCDALLLHHDDEQVSRQEPNAEHQTSGEKEAPSTQSASNHVLFKCIRWTRRLDRLTNFAFGVLAAALASLLFIRAEAVYPHSEALPLVANLKSSADQQTVRLERRAPIYHARGFIILPKVVGEPLPKFAEDISGLLFWAAPLPASAPGITVLPYTGLPQALPAFPKDIPQLIMISSSPGPDGRDYFIRTLAFEASGETEIGKVAVAHVILNRKKSGRWGRRIADVVTSPWQFEPWMTRRNEVERLPRTDPRYLEAAKVADAVLAGHIPDPTAGATHFLNPVIVRQRRGGSLPSWADVGGQPIGRHVFYCPDCDGGNPTQSELIAEGTKGGASTTAVKYRVTAPRVVQTATNGALHVGTAPAVLIPVAGKPEANSKPN